ncbi:MAG: hypothetical protein PHZ00_06465 [Candidatus Peribacteraceae bacterium]|nr:hypothetical protein [Candidatus Peribacteraceae bacterium]
METFRTIIEELEREHRGEKFADPLAFAQALETRAIELHVERAVTLAHGKTEELMHVTVEDLTAVRPEQEEEASGIDGERLIGKLEEAEAGHEVQEPTILAHALRLKAQEVLERQEVAEQEALAA